MAPDTLEKLLNKRRLISDRVSRFQTFLNNLDKENVDVHQLGTRLEKFKLCWDEFEKVQSEIDIKSDFEPSSEIWDEFEESYAKCVANSEGLILKFTTPKQQPQSVTFEPQIKLPTINLPTFNGAHDQWTHFHDTFDSLINQNRSLTNVQKFHYLRSSLKNEAAQVIQALEISAANYEIAWDLLRERFENKRLIIHSHVKALVDISPIIKESHLALRQLLDTTLKHIRSLKALGEPVEFWDTLIIYLVAQKLDFNTNKEWESQRTSNTLPTFNEFTEFLSKRCQLLEIMGIHKPPQKSQPQHTFKPSINKNFSNPNHTTSYASTFKITCHHCKGSHYLHQCELFLKMSIQERIDEVKRLKLCLNCFRSDHFIQKCWATNCRKCNLRHNTLIHLDKDEQVKSTLNNTTGSTNVTKFSPENKQSQATVTTHCANNANSTILLPTAVANIFDNSGKPHECRILLDSASQANFVTQEIVQLLQLQCQRLILPVSGINQLITNITQKTQITVQSKYSSFLKTISCLVLPKITENLPTVSVSASHLKLPENITLADPSFNNGAKIDVLLGSEIFWELLCPEHFNLGKGQPRLHRTQLGWIIAGGINSNRNQCKGTVYCNVSIGDANNDDTLEAQLQRFWELEECNQRPNLSPEERECENHFMATTVRDANGRFIVNLPFKDNMLQLGDSRKTALRRFFALEKRFSANSNLKHEYSNFMKEYEQLGHMTRISLTKPEPNVYYYIPHHAVVREESATTKLRVVYDASSKSNTGISLNDTLKVGPTIQDDLFSIILRFRIPRYVFIADIAKMYRQILVDENQRDMQRIFWRYNADQPVTIYRLNTVTYGTSSAPFLAVRCLKQLAAENEKAYPVASRALKTDMYVDDVLTGASSIEDAINLRRDLTSILNSAGFELRKFAANDDRILEGLGQEKNVKFMLHDKKEIKTLGLQWNSESDTFRYPVTFDGNISNVTKRKILSIIAQIFDPLGLIGPVTVVAKSIIQLLWQLQLKWDDPVPPHIQKSWVHFLEQLQNLNSLNIPRCVICNHISISQLHGFSDASEACYGASIYLRSTDATNNTSVQLLCAKSRIAPIKSVSLPRLELCGALLLSKLMKKLVISLTNVNVNNIFYWCDSTIVLAWLATSPNQLKTFVANRVTQIQELSCSSNWKHVSSKDNPADIISRGCSVKDLIQARLWWHGPNWLSQSDHAWPMAAPNVMEVPELRKVQSSYANVTINNEFSKSILLRFSNITKLQRVIAYCFRFQRNLRCPRENRVTGSIGVQELNNSIDYLVKLVQGETFAEEIRSLKHTGNVRSNSKLLSLKPFLDEHGVLRVGGRIRHANVNYTQKHPAILPSSHDFTKSLIESEHKRLLHAGAQHVLASLRLRYWLLAGRNSVRCVIHKCIKCFRAQPRTVQPIMGYLPDSRVTPSRPFSICGVDYGGPFLIKEGPSRSRKLIKAYMCVFVCFSTKAIHLELVGNLTTEAFLGALKRFISRRGKCCHIYSDNGTNFVGAKNELRELNQLLNKHNNEVSNFITSQAIQWHFSPARSPHFGGLWEAAVKSIKRHLRRTLSDAHLNYEEFYTLLTQIEACLNSRPLTPLSADPEDMNPLTPAHFLIGEALTALPEPDLTMYKFGLLKRFQRVQQLLQQFWRRWSSEYLAQLQQRPRWQRNHSNSLKAGTMVVVKEDHLPPLRWPLGRVSETHPGPDGVTRVVSIKTINGIIRRAVNKVCELPIAANNDQEEIN